MTIRLSIRNFAGLLFVFGVCMASAAAQSTLNFPRLTGPSTVTGVAIGNPDDTATAEVTMTAFAADGQLLSLDGVTNPVTIQIAPGQQYAEVAAEIFGIGPDQSDLVAWFQATSSTSNLSGFFLFVDEATTFLDGADQPPLGHKLLFNQVRIANGSSTELNIFNPNSRSTGLDLLLFDGDDVIQTNPDNIDFTLAGNGVARVDVADYFGVSEVSPGASVLVISDTQVGGFELISQEGQDVIGLNARPAGEFLSTLYFPQLAVLGPWVMHVGVSNYSNQEVSVVLTAFKPDGSRYDSADLGQNPVTRMLGPGRALREDVQQMFGFVGEQALDGWIQVDASSSAINGYVSYGVPANGSEAAVAALAQPQRSALFSHIATQLGLFTGVAALNPGASFADLEIIASQTDGTVLGSTTAVLAPGQRITALLSEIIPGAANQNGGLILIRSNRPLYYTSLFGTETGTVLANIPPQDVPEGFRPMTGLPEIRLVPDLAVVEPGQSVSFTPMGATAELAWQTLGRSGGPEDVGSVDDTGNYQAPADSDGNVIAGVVASQDDRTGSATVDVLERGNVLTPGTVLAVTYHQTLDQVFLAGQTGGSGTAGASSQIVRIEGSNLTQIATVEGVVSALVSVDLRERQGELIYRERPFLLALDSSNDRVYRIDPANGEVVEILTSTAELTDLAVDPVTGAFRLSSSVGIETVPRVLAETDLLDIPAEEALPPVFAVGASNGVSSLSVDGCSGSILFSRTDGSGIFRLDGSSAELIAEVAADRVRLLNRRDFGCPEGPMLLAADRAGRIALVRPSMGDALNWLGSLDAVDFAWVSGTASGTGEDAVLVAGSTTIAQGGATELFPVEVAGLFQPDPVNPVDALARGQIYDPAGDPFGEPELLQQEALEMSALVSPGGDELVIEMFFGETIAPCNEPCPNDSTPVDAVVGFIDLDVDRETGLVSTIDLNSPFTTGLKTNYCLDFNFYSPADGGVAVYRTLDEGERFQLVGRVPVEFQTFSFRVRLPLSLIGNPDPEDIRLAAVMGSVDQPTDTIPNGGAFGVAVTGTFPANAGSGFAPRSSWKAPRILRRVRDTRGSWIRLVPQTGTSAP